VSDLWKYLHCHWCLPHVDVEGVDRVDPEATGPAVVGVTHHTHTQQLVQVNAWPVEGQSAAGQC